MRRPTSPISAPSPCPATLERLVQLRLVFAVAMMLELVLIPAVEHLPARRTYDDELDGVIAPDAGAHLPDAGQLLLVAVAHLMELAHLRRECVGPRQRVFAINQMQARAEVAQTLLSGGVQRHHDQNGRRIPPARFPKRLWLEPLFPPPQLLAAAQSRAEGS